MWLVVSQGNDRSAWWLREGLAARVSRPVEWVTDEQLGLARNWCFRQGSSGTSISIELQDGRVIDSNDVAAVVNRLQQISRYHAPRTVGADRLYAFQELSAFYVSWLNAFRGPVLNPARPNGLSGSMLHGTEWSLLASRVGLQVPPLKLGTDESWMAVSLEPSAGLPRELLALPRATLFVVQDQVVGAGGHCPLTNDIGSACLSLSRLAGIPLLTIQFVLLGDGDWYFLMATPISDLLVGGEPLLDAVAAALTGGTR